MPEIVTLCFVTSSNTYLTQKICGKLITGLKPAPGQNCDSVEKKGL